MLIRPPHSSLSESGISARASCKCAEHLICQYAVVIDMFLPYAKGTDESLLILPPVPGQVRRLISVTCTQSISIPHFSNVDPLTSCLARLPPFQLPCRATLWTRIASHHTAHTYQCRPPSSLRQVQVHGGVQAIGKGSLG